MYTPGEEAYKNARIAFMNTQWGSFNRYCIHKGVKHTWGRICMLTGEKSGQSAREFFEQALEDSGLNKEPNMQQLTTTS